MVRADGIEPSTPAWKAGVLPLNYARLRVLYQTAGMQFGQVDLSPGISYSKCFTDFFMK